MKKLKANCELPEPVGGGSGGGTSTSNIRLNGVFSTYVGGIQVANDIGGSCTLGLNVSWDNDTRKGFVTASHCTEQFASFDGGDWYQFSRNSGKIGEEVIDRNPFYHAFTPSCPEEFNDLDVLCRYSDAALIEYSPSAFQQAELGYIAIPVARNSNFLAGTSDLYGYELVGAASWPYKNLNVHMVGKESGLKTGKITRSCTDINFNNDDDVQQYFFICLAKADYDSQRGDSGAPVITNSYSSRDYNYFDFEVMLVGFHVGRVNTDVSTHAYLSGATYTIGKIYNDVGGRCVYVDYNNTHWLHSEICNEASGYGPYEIRSLVNRNR